MQQLFALPDAFFRPLHPAAPGERILKIRFHVGNAVGAAHPDRVFKVMVQAAVVQIDGARHSFHAVGDHDLRMGKAGLPLADLHTRRKQRLVVGLGQCINEPLIRLAGQDQVHIHTALCRKAQGRFQLAV